MRLLASPQFVSNCPVDVFFRTSVSSWSSLALLACCVHTPPTSPESYSRARPFGFRSALSSSSMYGSGVCIFRPLLLTCCFIAHSWLFAVQTDPLLALSPLFPPQVCLHQYKRWWPPLGICRHCSSPFCDKSKFVFQTTLVPFCWSIAPRITPSALPSAHLVRLRPRGK
ncbi:hypothetical protein BR93DRAFT_689010 [Coniochaeta sp. PMI_546]|nr:hypothetical protein BR93DRAFT_689010 [Coniochaeta sp. PMI_546]